MTVYNAPCAHCWTLRDGHVGETCLFQPTIYRPLGELAVRTILRFYGHADAAPFLSAHFERGWLLDIEWVVKLTPCKWSDGCHYPVIHIETVRQHLFLCGLV